MPETLTPEQLDDLQQAVEDLDGKVLGYSGRGMYGARCIAVMGNGSLHRFLLRLGLLLGERRDDGDAGEAPVADLLEDAAVATDNMGLGWVVYWPDLQMTAQDEQRLEEQG